ncbi:MAG: hypothetical protein HYY96_10115 [Candidatus Tectomicrobia bacterium]|nr:hypothetical protein [Candidatus Tectomicrobia bacterium]
MSVKVAKLRAVERTRPREAKGALFAGDAILEIMEGYGVTDIISSPGSDWPAIWEALAKRRAQENSLPRYHNCRDETQVVAMAIGYYRATGRLPAVVLHTGVGCLHGAMALRSAMRTFVPMVVLAGDTDCFGEDPTVDPGRQWLEQLADVGGPIKLVEPYVKWAVKVPSTTSLPMILAHACKLALTPPYGPVVLSISMEVSFGDIPAHLMPKTGKEVSRTRPDAAAIAQVAELLRKSRRPVIVAERAGDDSGNVARLQAVAEELAIPVVEAGRAAVNMPDDHPLHVGFDVPDACKDADLLLLVGCRAPWHPASAEPAPTAKVVVLDEEPRAQLPMWHYRTDLFVYGNLGATLDDLLAHLRTTEAAKKARGLAKRQHETKARHVAVRRQYTQIGEAAGKLPRMQDAWVSHVLGQLLPAEAIVVEETITSRFSIQNHIQRSKPGTLISKFSGGLGMGFGIALGVKIAKPERLVVALVGDGSFYYSPALACFGFMQEYVAPILLVIYDNQSYSAMRGSLLKYYPKGYAAKTGIHYGSDIKPQTDYAGLAPIFGGYGEAVEEPAKLRPALERCLKEVKRGRFAILQAVIEEPAKS